MINKVYVGQPGLMLLDNYCRLLTEAYGPCYLVGACLERRDYRHVDIRMILPDGECEQLFGIRGPVQGALRGQLFCLGITKLLADISGLPVDFQIQSESRSNEHYANRRRETIGGTA